MELKLFDRLVLLNILPREGDITDIRILRKLREDLSLSEEEQKTLDIKRPGETVDDGTVVPEGQIRWRTEADVPKEVQIGDRARGIVRERLKRLNDEKKLGEEHIGVYEKFCESG